MYVCNMCIQEYLRHERHIGRCTYLHVCTSYTCILMYILRVRMQYVYTRVSSSRTRHLSLRTWNTTSSTCTCVIHMTWNVYMCLKYVYVYVYVWNMKYVYVHMCATYYTSYGYAYILHVMRRTHVQVYILDMMCICAHVWYILHVLCIYACILHLVRITHVQVQLIPLGMSFSKAQSSKLECLFRHVSVKRDVRALSFELWNSIRKCHPKWDWLYVYYDVYMCMWCVYVRTCATCDVS